MKVHGGCHCGAIRFEAEIDPEKVRICHCTDCQHLSGTAFRVAVRVPEGQFTLLEGSPKHYVKTAESGAPRAQAFCADCGTPLFAASTSEGPKSFGLRVGALDQRAQLIPKREIWCRSRLAWLPIFQNTHCKDTQ